MQVKGQTYKRALVTTETWCGNNQQEYVLGGKYSRFTAKVGLDDHSEQPTPLNFFVMADQKLVKKVSSVGLTAIEEADVPLTGVTRLAIGHQDRGRPVPERQRRHQRVDRAAAALSRFSRGAASSPSPRSRCAASR